MEAAAPSPLQVLIVEDSAEVAWRLRDMLAELTGVGTVDIAPDAPEALRCFASKRHQVVLLDVQLNCRGGLEVLRAIRALDKECLIIVLTQHDGEAFREDSLAAGADNFLLKSREFEKVAEIVEARARG